MTENFAMTSDGISIHYIDNLGSDSTLTPLVIVPGMMGIAEHHQAEISGLSPRRVIAITHRGLGKSGKVSKGQCSFGQRVTDIEAVISKLGISQYILYGFSRGVPLVVDYAIKNQNAVKALILHDCEPIYVRPSEKWYKHLASLNKAHMPTETIEAYWQDGANVDLTSEMSKFRCPILAIRGALEGSLLSLEKAEKLLSQCQNGRIAVLENSAHEVSNGDKEAFIKHLSEFCLLIDKGTFTANSVAMTHEFDLTSVSEVFHGSSQQGLSVITPRVSTHGMNWVYATPFIEIACTYLAKWDDLDFAQIQSCDDFHLVERYPGAFEGIFPQGKGSIYYLSPEKFTSFNYMEAVCKESVVPLREVMIENSWEYIQEISRTRRLFLHKYPSRPSFVPADDSDLFKKVSAWLDETPDWQSSSLFKRLQSKHPKMAVYILANTEVRIQLIPGAEAAPIVDLFYEQEGKSHRARNSDLFFAAFIENTIVGVCRFCVEENTPMLRSMIVHAPLRSHKIGAKILESFAQYLDKNNYRSTYCIPYDHLEKFYGLIGFKVIKEEDAPAFLQERIQGYRERNPEAFMIMRRD